MGCSCRAYFALLSLIVYVSACISNAAEDSGDTKKKQDLKKTNGSKYSLSISFIGKQLAHQFQHDQKGHWLNHTDRAWRTLFYCLKHFCVCIMKAFMFGGMIILITSKYNFFFKVLECLNLDFLEVKLGYHLLEKCNKTRWRDKSENLWHNKESLIVLMFANIMLFVYFYQEHRLLIISYL